ncbi:MAG: M13-type metalloendopeptidase [Pseudomonadota bacterium]
MKKTLAAFAALVLAACTPPTPAPAPPVAAPVSGVDIASLDAAAKPQDDFFRYVNGLWIAKTEIPADRGVYGSFHVLRDLSEQRVKQLIESVSQGKTRQGGEAQKIGDLYASFLDEARTEALGLKPLEPTLARIEALQDKNQIPALMAHFSRIGVDGFFDFSVQPDSKDSKSYIVYLSQSGLGLPDRDYYLLPDRKFRDLRKAYVEHIERLLTLAGDTEGAAQARKIMGLETWMAQRQWTKVQQRDDEKTYNKFERRMLAEKFPGCGWDDYAAKAGFADEASVIVREPSYFRSLGTLLRAHSLETLKLYLRWQTLHAAAPYLSQAYVDENFAFYGKALNGIPENRPRWKRGVQLVEQGLGEALGQLYVAAHFPPEHKQQMEGLVANLQKAYAQSFASLEWMTEETRKKALEKLAKFTPKIGYPAKWRDYSKLQIDRSDLLGNLMETRAFEYDRNLAKLGTPVDRDEWEMTPQTVNAYYHPNKNEIVFPAAILQPPFFNAAADDAVNYGAIGAVIGHEIGHGFDDQGSKYDGDGNLISWWTQHDRKKFEAKARQLIAQYDVYEPLPGYHVNGALSVGENLADLGGVTIAYQAYQLSLAGKPAPVMEGLTGDQRFFMGWAQVWRTKYREAALLNQLKVGPHSPAQYRCNGVLSNLPAFYDAFGIREGDEMYKSENKRVKVW